MLRRGGHVPRSCQSPRLEDRGDGLGSIPTSPTPGCVTTALPSSPGTVFVQWRWSIFPKQSAHPQALTPDGLWRKAGDLRRSRAQQQPGLQTQPCPLLPQGCARGLGDKQDNTEIVQAGVIQKIFVGFGSLSNSEAGTASNIWRSPGSIHHHQGKAARAQLLKISTCKEKRGLHLSHLLRADPASDTHSNPLRGLRQLQGGGNTEKFRTCVLWSQFQEILQPIYLWEELSGTWLHKTTESSLIFDWPQHGMWFPTLRGSHPCPHLPTSSS